MASAPLLLPGQPLPSSFTAPPQPKAGAGCYEYNGTILSSIVGRPRRDGATNAQVIGQVSRLSPQQAHIVIQVVNNHPVPESSEELTGVIKMGECFRLGDIVKAKVLSLGDARSYYLSTAANELGLTRGAPLLPISYQEMENPQTGETERRKVAKPEDI
ncbi:S1 CSL4 protein [Trichosporon asahii var. asahii CBS 8904]|uniref:S1 CSL4 protein n=2 Tax=Trichosporon asahii var. asahii TaxID=189963 RepID=K1VIB8_TRIAC|nr:S1 CSL4 protein [Trichosporon asahii var. asahii CBS 2479]EJT51278.1 S1 CSL4 protein [Trichosporon asahii var. asahii CBS 2479]EKC98886.1 S1 CSL4 protein [Trichosporon asahii var. asahii CBS 8904]